MTKRTLRIGTPKTCSASPFLNGLATGRGAGTVRCGNPAATKLQATGPLSSWRSGLLAADQV
jgi:hypothetical protein